MFLQETVLGAISAVVFFSLSVTLANSYSSAGVMRLYTSSSLISAGQAASVRNIIMLFYIHYIYMYVYSSKTHT